MNDLQKITVAGIIGITAFILMMMIGEAVEYTIGSCLNDSYVQYTTDLTINGETYSIVSEETYCVFGCRYNATDYGDECRSERGSVDMNYAVLSVWMFNWGFLAWLFKKWPRMSAPLMLVNALGGIFVTQNVLLIIPIVMSILLTLWKWNILRFNKDFFED